MFKRIISLTVSLGLLLQQTVFAYTANLNLSNYLNSGANLTALDRFRPVSLRYFSYQPLTNDFKVLLDKGDYAKSPGHQETKSPEKEDSVLKEAAKELMDYFKIGLSLPNDKFWVNLRPDSEDEIIDEELAKTDLGKVMLEADLKLKQDTALFTSPNTPQGKAYWDKLYKRAGELFGTENITIPTLTRPWIVPGEIILRESADKDNQASGAYIYKANLKVMLEEDYLKSSQLSAVSSQQYEFNDPRLKELNQYSTQLIRELILPRLTQKVNSSKDYANLRQVYFSLILARWFKETFNSQPTANSSENNDSYIKLIDSNNLTNLTSKTPWDKTTYFNAYQKSFQEGEYNLSEPIYTPTGQVIRRYMSGGVFMKTNPGIFTAEGDPTSLDAEAKGKVLFLNGEKVQKSGAIQAEGQIEKTAASAMVEERKLLLTTPRLNFSDLKSLEASLKGIVSPGVIYFWTFKVINETALRNELIDKLVYDATFNPNQDIVNETRRLIKGIAVSLGAKPDSTYNLYLEKAKDSRHYTIPAINIRGMAYNTARAVFESAVKNNVKDPFMLEIARSEIGYTAQRPAEYTTSILAAAIKEGFKLPVYLQGDHFQITAKEHKENLPAAMEKVQKLIREAIEAGFYQIDLDTSTLVDWSKPTAAEQQELNYKMAAKLTAYVRQLERDLGLDRQGIVVNLGGEIGEIGMGLEKGKERNSSVEDLRAFMNGYNAELERLSKELGFKLNPITKVAVQSGTKHGGVRDSAGKVIKAKVGFNTLAELGKVAREEFGLAGVVQHGASTLPEDYFTVFAGNKMPAGLTIDESLLNQEGQTTLDSHPVAEVHLATAYQDTVLDHPEFPADLREEIVKRILEWNPPKEGQDPNKVFVDNRKNAWGEFKLQTWNMPFDIQTAMRNSLRAQFDTVFKNLGLASSAVETAGEASKNPALRLAQINNLISEIDKEIVQPGSGNLPEVVYISDFHGEIKLFLDYIADAVSQKIGKKVTLDHNKFPSVSIAEQLKSQRVNISKAGVTFNILGDFLDRGKYGVKCFLAAKELMDLGVSGYITGNHDFWAFLNLMGFHLPIYRGYNFYGHKKSEELVENHWNDSEIAGDRLSWWTKKLAEYNASQLKLQEGILKIGSEEKSIKDIRKRVKEIYSQFKDQFNPEEKELLEDLSGFYFGSTDVYAGFNGIGMMSEQWWQDRLSKVNIALQNAEQSELSHAVSIWKELQSYAQAADEIVDTRLEDALNKGKWEWQVFNDINHQNYTSVEWWGKDWSSHKDWGTAVIDEINGLEGSRNWNQENYINNPYLKDLAEFYRGQFNLSLKDVYGNMSTHGWLPVDKQGQIRFTYKGTTYEGKYIWEGLRVIADDIKDLNKPLSELHEALSLVNSWYADKTTKIKPKDVAGYIQKIGLEKIYKNIGIKTWLTCHNPLNKLHPLGVGFTVRQGDYVHLSVDKGMSYRKFNDLGGYVMVDSKGIRLRGHADTEFSDIKDNPPTVLLEEDAQKGLVVRDTWENESLGRNDSLSLMKKQLEEERGAITSNFTPLTTPRLNFSDLKSLEASLKGIVEEGVIYAGTFKVINETALKNELIDKLVYDATFNPNQDIVNETRRLIKGIAVSLGAKPDSTYNLYLEKAKDSRHYTIPAINIRGMAYNTARAVFESAVRNKVEDPFILEIARSEIGYTAQRPAEYTTSILAAAIKEGYKLPVYLQGDHFQITAKEFKEDSNAGIEKVQKLIREAIEAGFYQIDLDTSTLVDWSKLTADQQQELNYKMAANLTGYVRLLEKDLGLDKQGIVVNLGGEIGEIGMGLEKGKERNSSVEDLRAFMNGYNFELERLGRKLGFRLNPITKVAVQSGTKHGGVRDSAGKVIKAKVGFNTLAELGKAAREEFGLAGVVQHGASTLPEDYFTVFAGNKMPTGLTIDESLLNQEGQTTLDSHPVAEVHLATAYQDTVLDHPEFPADLREEIVKRILEWNPPKEGQDSNKVFVDNRKNAWGEFKLQTWNMPSDIQTAMRNSLRAQFDTVFKNLGLASSAVDESTDLEKSEVSKWIDEVHRYAFLKSSIEYLKKELGKMPQDSTLQDIIPPYEKEWQKLGNPNDFLPEALKKAEEQKREYVVAGNWKMAVATEEEALDLVRGIARAITAEGLFVNKDNIDIVIPIAPSFVHIGDIHDEIYRLRMGGIIRLAAQDVSSEKPGALTSQVSAKSLKDKGTEYVIIGHSERRRLLNETSKIVNAKAKMALEVGLKPIICLGESLEERDAGKTFTVVAEQLVESLEGLTPEQLKEIVIAYEPVWAIGTGRTATPEQANDVHRFIRALLFKTYGYETASKMQIQYGGSVKAENIASLIVEPNIDGALVGGDSLKPVNFVTIIKESLKHSRSTSSAMMSEDLTGGTPGKPKKSVGGIDFRQMNMLIQPQGSFASSSLDFSLPLLSKAEIESFDLDTELAAIQRMASSGIAPSYQRLKEYLAVCFAKERTGNEIDNLKLCLLDIFEREQFEAKETPDGYKEVLVIADTKGYVLREDRLAAVGQKTVNLN